MNFQLSAEFCPYCGALIDLYTLGIIILCQVCHMEVSFKEFEGKPSLSRINLAQKHEWIRKHLSKAERQRKGKAKMIINQKCPQCNNPEMKYHTLQTRSADEGSTVFYECEKCSFTYSINN